RDDFGDFLDVLQPEVFDMALIARLRPAALLVVLRFLPFDLCRRLDAVQGEDEYPRRMRVGQQGEVAWILVDEARDGVEMRLVRDIQPMPFDRRGELDRHEQIGAVAGEQSEAVD